MVQVCWTSLCCISASTVSGCTELVWRLWLHVKMTLMTTVLHAMIFIYSSNNLQITEVMYIPTSTTKTTRHRVSTSTRWHFTFRLCCHSNEARAPTANLPNRAQLEGTPYHSSKLHPGLCSSVGIRRGTDTQTHNRVTNIHFALSTTHAKCNNLTPMPPIPPAS